MSSDGSRRCWRERGARTPPAGRGPPGEIVARCTAASRRLARRPCLGLSSAADLWSPAPGGGAPDRRRGSGDCLRERSSTTRRWSREGRAVLLHREMRGYLCDVAFGSHVLRRIDQHGEILRVFPMLTCKGFAVRRPCFENRETVRQSPRRRTACGSARRRWMTRDCASGDDEARRAKPSVRFRQFSVVSPHHADLDFDLGGEDPC